MKKFDQDEKYIIFEIVKRWKNGQAVCLADIVDNFLVDIDVKLDYQNHTVELLFDQQKFLHLSSFTSIVTDKAWLLMRFVTLLKYLQKLEYIYLYQQGNIPTQPTRFGQLVQGSTPVTYNISDPIIIDFLLQYSYRTIVVGQILIDYVDNDYKTDEEIRHIENKRIAEKNLEEAHNSVVLSEKSIKNAEKSLKLSKQSIKVSEDNLQTAREGVKTGKIGVWIAIILGVLSLIISTFSIYNSSKPNKNPIPIEIQANQLKEILENNIDKDKIEDIIKKSEQLILELDTVNLNLKTLNKTLKEKRTK